MTRLDKFTVCCTYLEKSFRDQSTDKNIQAELIQFNITMNFLCAVDKAKTDIAFLRFYSYGNFACSAQILEKRDGKPIPQRSVRAIGYLRCTTIVTYQFISNKSLS